MKDKRQTKKKSTFLNLFRKNSNQNDKQQPPHDSTNVNPQKNNNPLGVDTKQHGYHNDDDGNKKKNNAKTKSSNGFSFPNRVKSPGGLEVHTPYNPNNDLVDFATAPGGGGVLYHNDDVSVMTPVTGLQPDSPDRFRRTNDLHCGFDVNPYPDYSAKNGNDHHGTRNQFHGTPSRGEGANGEGMGINLPVITPGDFNDDSNRNKISSNNNPSATTATTTTTTTTNAKTGAKTSKTAKGTMGGRRRLSPPPILLPGYDDDESSRDPSIYEDLSAVGSNNTPFKISTTLPSQNGYDGTENRGHRHAMTPTENHSSSKLAILLQTKTSWLTQTRYFQKVVDWSFDVVDSDDSGDVSLEELYSGLLLVHLKFAVYVGAPACRPASREYVAEIFHLLDTDDSGTLTKEEFTIVMKILYSQVLTRIVIQWTLTLMIVPLISQYIIHYSKIICSISHDFWKNIDDDIDPLQRLFYKLWSNFLHLTPEWMDQIGRSLWKLSDEIIPKGIWNSMPMTILTLGQTSVLLPFALSRVEEFFRGLAHGNVGEVDAVTWRKKVTMN